MLDGIDIEFLVVKIDEIRLGNKLLGMGWQWSAAHFPCDPNELRFDISINTKVRDVIRDVELSFLVF